MSKLFVSRETDVLDPSGYYFVYWCCVLLTCHPSNRLAPSGSPSLIRGSSVESPHCRVVPDILTRS